MNMVLPLAAALLGSTAAWADEIGSTSTGPMLPVPQGDSHSAGPGAQSGGGSPGGHGRLKLEELAIAPELSGGLLVVIVDPDGYLGDALPTGRFGLGSDMVDLEFRDDGESPDGVAGDRQYVALAPIVRSEREAMLQLTGPSEEELWADLIPIPLSRELPWVALRLLSAGGHISTGQTNDLDAEVDDGSPGQGSSSGGGGTGASSGVCQSGAS